MDCGKTKQIQRPKKYMGLSMTTAFDDSFTPRAETHNMTLVLRCGVDSRACICGLPTTSITGVRIDEFSPTNG